MKTRWTIALITGLASAAILVLVSFRQPTVPRNHAQHSPKGCVFKTVYEGEGLDSNFLMPTTAQVLTAETRAYDWMLKAQNNDGGFAAGSHASQNVMDPHASPSDPATTAMVSMSLLRAGSTPENGRFANVLARTTEFLLKAVEGSSDDALNITELQGTQIQVKLGQNIDVALTAQYLSNLMGRMACNDPKHDRWLRALNKCTRKIQRSQTSNGSVAGNGWAGVLQSSFATNALESAQHVGADVDDEALEKARDFQKANFDVNTGSVATDAAAGVTLYAVSGSTRSSAKEARKAEEDMDRARAEGKVDKSAPVTVKNLEQAGYTKDEAEKMNTAWQVYNAAKTRAQSNEVISGFGNNGGEEFLSFLQTGESLIINKDNSWKNWYGATSARLVEIQNNDGSWSGHHCITSPVFCTATSLLILSVNNDIEQLVAQGATVKK
ncbi:MAG: terpene cyclase/mutase family protein [Flavobacteriales bacterium]|nr:terpene cyclase/mutase family protein [Flavobacteriales bacterium]MBP6696762.1 terpene cyclase/mutase family protein [Flavobacteriales bacterium]